MKVVQIGSNKGNDDLSRYLKQHHKDLKFGLFVEANSLHISDLTECYKNYSNVFIENIAIKIPDHLENNLQFFYHTKDGPLYAITSCKKEHIEKHIEMCPHLAGGEIKSFNVPCITIRDLFKKYQIQDLDWLLLDVEGIDAEILLTTDWNLYDIKRIEFESLHLNEHQEKIEQMFKRLNYVRTNSLNLYDQAWVKNTGENKMEVTLYAICKNEEKNIEKFIENSKKFPHTVVVDTGSTDRTVELLKESGIEVHEHPQTREEFDFSIARNQALSYVKTDWAFSLDFNEDIDEFFPDGLGVISEEFTSFKHLRFDKEGDNDPIESNEVHTRFHRTQNYTWVNAVHEVPQFIPTEKYLNDVSVDTTIKITKIIQKSVDKQLFYLSICEREFQKDSNNWYYLWFIFNHYVSVENLSKALEYGQEFLNISKPYFNHFRVRCFIICSQILCKTGNVNQGANYAFHALSEAMNFGGETLGGAFVHLLNIGKLTQNPNIIVFSSAFSEETLRLKDRTSAIDKLFLTNLDDIPSTSWSGHRRFAEWLLQYIKPKVIVDLGVDYGYSTFTFSIPRIGHVYGIDNFVGDDYVGIDTESMKYKFVMMKREKLHLQDNLTFIKGDFNEVAKTWDKKIDILHIDGSHHYEDVKRDFETWSQFVSDDGVILMHDTCVGDMMVNGIEYGVRKFFDTIELPKFTFTNSFGLGVISKNKDLIESIQQEYLASSGA